MMCGCYNENKWYIVCKSQSDLVRIMQEACDNLFAWASREVFGHKPTLPNEYYKQHPLTIFVLAPEIAPNTWKKKNPNRLIEEQRQPIVALMYGLTQEAAHIALWSWLRRAYGWSHKYDMCLTHVLFNLSQAVWVLQRKTQKQEEK